MSIEGNNSGTSTGGSQLFGGQGTPFWAGGPDGGSSSKGSTETPSADDASLLDLEFESAPGIDDVLGADGSPATGAGEQTPPAGTTPAATPPAQKPAPAAETEAIDDADGDEGEESDIDADLLREATDLYGFTAEEAKSFGSTDNLRRGLSIVARRMASLVGPVPQFNLPPAQQQPPQQQAAPPAAPPAQAPPAPTSSVGGMQAVLGKYQFPKDPAEEFDEVTAQVLNGLNDHYHQVAAQQQQVIDSLRAEFFAISSNFARQEATRVTEEIDGFFNSLGDEWKDEYGTGTLRDFSPDSPQFKNRMEFVGLLQGLMTQLQQHNPKIGIKEAAQAALRARNGDRIEQIARKKGASQVLDRVKGQSVSRPAPSTKKRGTPEERAVSTVAKKLKSFGVGGAEREETIEDLL